MFVPASIFLVGDDILFYFIGQFPVDDMYFLLDFQTGYAPSTEKGTVPASDEDVIKDIMEQHGQFVGSIQSRLSKLQVIHSDKVLFLILVDCLYMILSDFSVFNGVDLLLVI